MEDEAFYVWVYQFDGSTQVAFVEFNEGKSLDSVPVIRHVIEETELLSTFMTPITDFFYDESGNMTLYFPEPVGHLPQTFNCGPEVELELLDHAHCCRGTKCPNFTTMKSGLCWLHR